MAQSRYQPIVSFVSGELTPLLRGRFDMAQYRQGCEVLRNMMPLPFGGAKRRAGTEFLNRADSDATGSRSRLIPFHVSVTESYVIAIGPINIVVYNGTDGTVAATIPTPFGNAYESLDYEQAGLTLIFTGPNTKPTRLVKTSSGWGIGAIRFSPEPTAVLPDSYPASSFSPASSNQNGSTVVFTGTPPSGSLNRTITQGNSLGVVQFVFAGSFNVIVETGFDPASTLPFEFSGPLQWSITPTGSNRVGGIMNVSTNGEWDASRIGSVININGGKILITGLVDASNVTGEVLQELVDTTGATGASWSLESKIWGGGTKGYPRAVAFHEQRLLFAGWNGNPTGIVASAIGIPFDFRVTELAEDGYAYALQTSKQTSIQYLVSDQELIVHTDEGEYALLPSNNEALSSVNIPRARPQSKHGCRRIKPISVNEEPVFVRFDGRRTISMGYDGGASAYVPADIAILAEHLFKTPIIDMTFARTPVPTIYCVLADGTMACCTYDRSQSVVAWWPWDTNGKIESVTAVSSGERDEVYMCCTRIGDTHRVIERVRDDWYPRNDEAAAGDINKRIGVMLDCATLEISPAFLVEVDMNPIFRSVVMTAVADGYDAGERAVPLDNTYQISNFADRIAVGFNYTSELAPMPNEAATQSGTGQGRPVRTGPAMLKVHNSIGGTVNDLNQIGPSPVHSDDSRATPIELLTGESDMTLQGWKRDEPSMRIKQVRPYPLHVLFISERLSNAP